MNDVLVTSVDTGVLGEPLGTSEKVLILIGMERGPSTTVTAAIVT
jgi:hypothetical protein